MPKSPTIMDDPALTVNDRNKLNQLHPIVADKIARLIIQARKEKLNVGIFNALRSFDAQKTEYAKGRDDAGRIIDKEAVVTYSRPGYSLHQYGLACDIVFKTINSQWTWDDRYNWKRLGEIGESFGLTWGGRWTTPKDLPHFQYSKGIATVEVALALYNKSGLPAVWKLVV